MARKPTGRPSGRPRTEIDWDQFRELCIINCTAEEICGVLGVCKDTLYDRVREKYGVSFSTKYDEYSQHGKSSLRRAQWAKALKDKSEGMQKWLGVNVLGQKNAVQPMEGNVSVGITPADVLALIEKAKDSGSNK